MLKPPPIDSSLSTVSANFRFTHTIPINAHLRTAPPIFVKWMEMETLSKLDVEDQPFSLYLLTAQNAGAFQLRAFDGKESWTARITQRQLKEMADNVCNFCMNQWGICCVEVSDAINPIYMHAFRCQLRRKSSKKKLKRH